MTFTTPSLTTQAETHSEDLIDDERRSVSPDSIEEDVAEPTQTAATVTAPTEVAEDVESWRNQWIGEVDLPESMCSRISIYRLESRR